ncbi:hypothetical protein [Blastopirellula marina]|uniref:hypothetical protein n=1 Tax=Blastopirellula marina TaxID=124 RepID=UPI000322E5F5|nr:hypothetical protein [Blastopirellula marina]
MSLARYRILLLWACAVTLPCLGEVRHSAADATTSTVAAASNLSIQQIRFASGPAENAAGLRPRFLAFFTEEIVSPGNLSRLTMTHPKAEKDHLLAAFTTGRLETEFKRRGTGGTTRRLDMKRRGVL